MKAAIIIVNVIGACLFGLFAWFQINDNSNAMIYERPSNLDVTLWVIFYACIASIHAIGIFRPAPIALLVFGVLICLLQLMFSMPAMFTNLTSGEFTLAGAGMQASEPQVERSREFLGACIALTGVVAVAYQRRWWPKSTKKLTLQHLSNHRNELP